MVIHVRKLGAGLLLATSVSGFATAAYAQDKPASAAKSDDGDRSNDDIVVTALKGNSKLRETPATIQVIPATVLADRAITSVLDLPKVVPTLAITPSTLGNNGIRLYGLGTPASALSFDQSVLPLVDGAPMSHSRVFQTSLFDISDVQVLKGVQAAVIGKNSSIGAISISTRKPENRFGYNIATSYEPVLGSTLVDMGIDLPLGKTLSLRVAGRIQHNGGWVHNDIQNTDGPDANTKAIRGTLLWEPTSSFSYTLSSEFARTTTTGVPYELYLDRTGSGALLCAAAGVTTCEFNIDRHTQSTDLTTWGGINNLDKVISKRFIGTGRLDLGPVTLTSISSFQELNDRTIVDADRLPGGYFTPKFVEKSSTFTQELRLNSNGDCAVRYMFGGFFQRDIYDYNAYAQWNTIGGRSILTGTNIQVHHQVTNDLSAFGQLSIAPVKGFRITGGLRYTHMFKIATPYNTLITAGTYTASQPPFPQQRFTKSENALDYSIAAQFDVTSNLMLYASYGKGTKSGGFSTGGKYTGAYNAATTPALIYSSTVYKPEVAHIAEGGFKLDLRSFGYINASIYDVEVDNAQQSFSTGGTIVFISRDLTSRGINFEAEQRPVPGLRIYENVNYSLYGRDRTVDAPLIYNPRWSGNVGFDVRNPVGGDWTLTAGPNLMFRSNQYNTTPGQSGDIKATFGGIAVLGARIKLANSNGWEFSVIGENLNNKVVVTSGITATGVSGIQVSTDRPRTVWFRLSYSR